MDRWPPAFGCAAKSCGLDRNFAYRICLPPTVVAPEPAAPVPMAAGLEAVAARPGVEVCVGDVQPTTPAAQAKLATPKAPRSTDRREIRRRAARVQYGCSVPISLLRNVVYPPFRRRGCGRPP